MKSIRVCTRIGSLLIGTVCAVVVAAPAHAQAYPSRTIEFVAQSSPGGGTDLFMRNITDFLRKEKAFSQSIITSNRVGGGGAVAYTHIKSKRGDPHVVMTMATEIGRA